MPEVPEWAKPIEPVSKPTNVPDWAAPIEQPEEQIASDGLPSLTQGEGLTWWDKAMDLFDDPEAEGARSVQALVDAEALNISPSAAYRYKDAIDRGEKINSKAATLRSNLMERINQSWDTGTKQNQLGEIGYDYIVSGDPRYLDNMQKVSGSMPTEAETFISESKLETATRSAAKMMPMMVDTAMESGWKGLALGTGFGLISMLAGQPEIVAPMAMAGVQIGGAEGAFEASMRKEAGLALHEIMQLEDAEGNKIDPNIARATSFGVGAINGAIEVLQLKKILETIPGAKKLLSDAVINTVTNKSVMKQLSGLANTYAGTVATETGQEIAQESVNIVFSELAKSISRTAEESDIDPASVGEIVERLKDTAIESAQAFSIIALPGMAAQAAGVRPPQKETEQAPEAPEAAPEAQTTEEPTTTPQDLPEIDEADVDAIISATDEELDAVIESVISKMEGGRFETFKGQVSEVVGTEETEAVSKIMEARAKAVGMTPDEYVEYHGLEVRAEEEAEFTEGQVYEQATGDIKTETPEFKEWFGDSKVVDEQGEPLVVYHGTAADFDTFDVERVGQTDEGWLGLGLYFTPKADVAEAYGGIVMPTYLSIKNPFTFPEEVNPIKFVDEKGGAAKFTEWVKDQGFDGIISDRVIIQTVAFDPTQIKSVNNRGTFDPTDPNIYKQDGVGVKASIAFEDKKTVIRAFEKADVSSLVHELGHLFRRDIGGEDLAIAEEWAGVENGKWTRPSEEKFARGFERYLAEGKAPTEELAGVFEQFKNWLIEIYKSIRGSDIDVALSPEIIGVFDRLLTEQETLQQQEGVQTLEQREPVKTRIRRVTGQAKDTTKTVSEREALKASLKKAAQAARIAQREGKAEGVATERARLKELLAKQKQRKESTVGVGKDIKAIKKAAELKGAIAVDYQKKIKELTKNLDFKRMTEKTRARLQGLADFIEKEGVPVGINKKRVEELNRLAKTPIRDMTPEEIKQLRNQIEELRAIGRLKQKLKYKYKEKEKQEKLKQIKESTNNLDPHVLHGKDRMRDKIKTAGVSFYTDTLHTPRVAELADNFQKDGPQQKFIREMGKAEQSAIAKSVDREIALMGKLEEIGANVIQEGSDSDIKMMINMRYREGALTQAKTLMDKYGYSELPKLTAKEEKILEAIRQDMEENKPDLVAAWEEVENEIFPEQDVYYLPLKYEKEEAILPGAQVQGRGRTTHTFDGFSHKRRPNVKKVPRVGALQIYKEAVLEQEWYKNIQPVIEDVKSVVLTEEYKDSAGEILHDWWNNQVDLMARRGWSASATTTAVSGLLRRTRHNINTAVLGYKLSTIIMQPFAIFDGMAYVNAKLGPKVAAQIAGEVMKSFVLPGYTKQLVRESEALKQRQGGELAITEELAKAQGESIKDKSTRLAFKLITQADLKTAGGVQETVRKALVKAGMSKSEALSEAEFIMKMSQGDSSVAFRPHILSKGEGARTWFTFQSFIMNRWGLLVHDLITGKITKGQFKGKVAGLMSIAILMMAGATEDEAREWLYEFIQQKELKKDNRSTMEKVFVELFSSMPFFGSLIESASTGRDSAPPAIRVAQKGMRGTRNALLGEDAEDKAKGAREAAESLLILGVGFPGTAQAFDLLEGAIED